MDILSVIGIVLALVAITGGQIVEGGNLGSLLNLPAVLIVIGGTTGAILLQAPLSVFMHALKSIVWVFLPPKTDLKQTIEKIVGWSNIARKEGLLGLEGVAESEKDPFVHKGLQLLIDGTEPDAIRKILEVDLETREHHDLQAAKVFEGMGGYSPTIGIIGAVLGLIHVMENLADPSKLGAGIASAFVATVYGVGFANLFMLPISNKLKSVVQNQTQARDMVIDGLLSIAEGENPRNIETKLLGYVV
jgi:chemotaxis protein MotA